LPLVTRGQIPTFPRTDCEKLGNLLVSVADNSSRTTNAKVIASVLNDSQ